MFKKMIVVFAAFVSSNSFADQCLERASSSDLLSELGRRLEQGSTGGQTNATAYCDRYDLTITLVDLQGREKKLVTGLSDPEQCARQLGVIGSIHSYGNGRVVNFCERYNMIRTQVRADDIVRLSTIGFSNQAECELQAKQANRH